MALRALFATVVIVMAIAARAAMADPAPTSQPSQAAVIVLRGEVDNYSRDTLMRRFDSARAVGAKTVIVQIDTYGGLASAGLEISQFLKRQNDLHTVAFIDKKAYSAGAMIALACDEMVMQPGSVVGDCAPIMFRSDGSLDALPAAERAKAESPILADFRDSAQRNGYNPLLAESMVAVDRVVYFVENGKSGERKFVNESEYQALPKDAWQSVPAVPNPVDDGRELLTVHADLAQKLGLSRGQFDSPEQLASSRGWEIIQTYAPGVGEAIIQTLNTGWARMILIAIFILSVKVAFSTPGHGVAEALSLLTLGLIVGIPLLTGYAQWWEILMIFAGLALVAFEIFVFPGHFVSGIVGLLMMIGGLVLTFVPTEPGHPGFLPHMGGTWLSVQRGLLFVTGGMLCSLLLWLWLQRYLPKLPYFGRLILTTTSGGIAASTPVDSKARPATLEVGMIGRTVSELRPGGHAAFDDATTGAKRIVDVVSEDGFVASDAEVVVREVRGSYAIVRPA